MNGLVFLLIAVPAVILLIRAFEWIGDRVELRREEKSLIELYQRERMRRALEK